MLTRFALGLGLALVMVLGAQSAFAGFTLIEKEYVGNVENKNKVGGGDMSAATDDAGRFAGSDNTIAEGPPPGRSGECTPASQSPDDGECFPDYVPVVSRLEFFRTEGTLPTGTSSVNGWPVDQNIPTCVDPTGAGSGQIGLPALYTWAIGLERPIVSDIQIQICLDVRKCQEEDDDLGAASTVGIRDYVDQNGWEAPSYLRVTHVPGDLNPIVESRIVPNLVVPGLFQTNILGFGDLPDLPSFEDPGDFEQTVILEESVSFIGRDCITKWIPNDGLYAAHDIIGVELRVPSSTRVRVRAAADSTAVCYVGTPLPGECEADPDLCGK